MGDGKGGAAGAWGRRLPLGLRPAVLPLPAGCFHVPRCLAMCEEMLGALLGRLAPAPSPGPGSPAAVPARQAAK